jgi:hypothetical protein
VIARVLAAIVVAWAAGGGVVALGWPRRNALPPIAWLALSGLIGPFVVGAALLAAGSGGVPAHVSVPGITALAIAAGAWGAKRRWQQLPGAARTPWLVLVAVVVAIGWSGWVAARTHLGWDGTVVWYQKGRILAASAGAMPTSTLADPTRSWTAPDYPLHVPLALAWVRLWQPIEDERAMKALPAAWCAAILLLVAAAVLERSSSAAWTVAAVTVVASAPRLLIGEGSFTSGYGDGPMAGLLAALIWLLWRSGEAGRREWVPLIAMVAAALAATKQEGAAAVAVAAAVCAGHGRDWRRLAFAVPAVLLALGWQGWTWRAGAPGGMAYEWRGAGPSLARLAPIATAYLAEFTNVARWGLLWPGLTLLGLLRRPHLPAPEVTMVILASTVSALAFVGSDWPEVSMHLNVTVPRLIASVVPSIVVVCFGASGSESHD